MRISFRGKQYVIRKRFWFILGTLALAVLLLALFIHFFYPSKSDTPVYVSIEEGESVASVATKLKENRIITSATIFRFLAWFEGKGKLIKAGEYLLYPGSHYGEVFSILTRGPEIITRLTVPEGFTVGQISRRLAQQTTISEEEFSQAIKKGDYQLDILPPEQKHNLEGFLFPKTYDIYPGTTAEELVSNMLDRFKSETSDLGWEEAQKLGVTPYQALIIASLIEREVAVDEERPLVAAVIYNRLRLNMFLQIDATVQYALPQWKEVLTYDDLKTPSPYNTYLHKGLPPAPICNPGRKSIYAALHPAQVNYLYYVATGEGQLHFFTADYSEFLRAKSEAQRK